MELEVIKRVPVMPRGGSPLLFVHGVCHAAWCWEHWVGWFADRGRKVHALSLRGHGASAGREDLDSFGLNDYRDDVLNTARAMDKPILVGHSMGGAVAQLAVAADPALFKALVLVASPPPDGLRIREMLPLLRQLPGLLSVAKLGKGKRLSVREVQGLPFFDGRISDENAARFGEQLQRDSKAAGREAGIFRAPAFQARLPVLVLGAMRDRLLAPSALKRTALHYSGDLILLDEPCHDLMLDPAWEEGAAKLQGWLADRAL